MIKRMMIASLMLMNVVHASEDKLQNLRNEPLLARREELLQGLNSRELDMRKQELLSQFKEQEESRTLSPQTTYAITAECCAISFLQEGTTRREFLHRISAK